MKLENSLFLPLDCAVSKFESMNKITVSHSIIWGLIIDATSGIGLSAKAPLVNGAFAYTGTNCDMLLSLCLFEELEFTNNHRKNIDLL